MCNVTGYLPICLRCNSNSIFSYETENGIKAEETGTLKKTSGPEATDVIVAQGAFSYTAPDGTLISLNYVADDEGGFKPEVGLTRGLTKVL